MSAFELETPRERLRYFNVKDYPSMTAVANSIQGTMRHKMTPEQSYAKKVYQQSLMKGNYHQLELMKYFPLDSEPVDTEVSMRKLEQGLLFKSTGPLYATTPTIQPRVFGGQEPLKYGQWYQDPQGVNPTGGKIPDIY